MSSSVTRGIFHVHTSYSHDGKLTPKELGDFLYAHELRFAVLSDHAEDLDPGKMKRLVSECDALRGGGAILVPGIEYRLEQWAALHLICFGIREYLPGEDPFDLIGRVRAKGGMTVVAHPSRAGNVVSEEIASAVDGIEVWNAAYDSRYVPDPGSLALYRRLKKSHPSLLAFGGNDMHDEGSYRGLDIEMQGVVRETGDVMESFREGRFGFRGRWATFDSSAEAGTLRVLALRAGRCVIDSADALYWFLRGTATGGKE